MPLLLGPEPLHLDLPSCRSVRGTVFGLRSHRVLYFRIDAKDRVGSVFNYLDTDNNILLVRDCGAGVHAGKIRAFLLDGGVLAADLAGPDV